MHSTRSHRQSVRHPRRSSCRTTYRHIPPSQRMNKPIVALSRRSARLFSQTAFDSFAQFASQPVEMCQPPAPTDAPKAAPTPKVPTLSKKDKRDFTHVFHATFPQGTPVYVDTHTHIDAILSRLNNPRGAKDSAVEPTTAQDVWTTERLSEQFLGNWDGSVTVSCERESKEIVENIINNDTSDKIYAAFGLHPHEADNWDDAYGEALEQLMSHPKVRAWGECGLDYFYDHSDREIQKEVFIKQIQLATKHKKPLVVHTRDAEIDTLAILTQYAPKDMFIHIHCCTSSVELIRPLLEHFPNLYVGFTGVITFKNVDSIITTLNIVPINRLLLETDGPFMAPMPFRGMTAHSGMIPFTALKMAQVKQVELPTLMQQVRENTKAFYGF